MEGLLIIASLASKSVQYLKPGEQYQNNIALSPPKYDSPLRTIWSQKWKQQEDKKIRLVLPGRLSPQQLSPATFLVTPDIRTICSKARRMQSRDDPPLNPLNIAGTQDCATVTGSMEETPKSIRSEKGNQEAFDGWKFHPGARNLLHAIACVTSLAFRQGRNLL
ncbi:hypothetical protein K505DRAFT_7588 [Melanomma pulvis-pyrius CBS 109.77]|uniref:Uncharacterized protein n=1 Tax=Melanomma pulvis-pyrius CBS 109.77 TaxID=1314802 RepID=A0A6A6XVI8_9PLEO|nr:hypothetical protein K505DRAFT_7588 [Melanomma pulvis-pyrius CBS 109.77]